MRPLIPLLLLPVGVRVGVDAAEEENPKKPGASSPAPTPLALAEPALG